MRLKDTLSLQIILKVLIFSGGEVFSGIISPGKSFSGKLFPGVRLFIFPGIVFLKESTGHTLDLKIIWTLSKALEKQEPTFFGSTLLFIIKRLFLSSLLFLIKNSFAGFCHHLVVKK